MRSGRRPEKREGLAASPQCEAKRWFSCSNRHKHLAVIREQDNAVEWYDRLKAILPRSARADTRHRNAIELNFCLLQLRAGKLDECRALLDGLMESQKDASEPVLIDFYLRHMVQREAEEDSKKIGKPR